MCDFLMKIKRHLCHLIDAYETLKTKGAKKIDPFKILKTMSSTASANLTSLFKIKGLSYSISAACATSSHCIGNAFKYWLMSILISPITCERKLNSLSFSENTMPDV
jgi:hypothetical protein